MNVQMKKEKRYIIYVGNFDITNMNAAGKRVLNISKLLEKNGYKIILVESTKNKNFDNHFDEKKISDDIYLFSLPYPKKSIERIHYKKTYNYIINLIQEKKLYNKIGYMIFYGTPSISLFLSLMLKFNKKNNIISISDTVDWLKINFKNPFANIIKKIDSYNKRRINKKMDGIIVISTYLQRYYKNNKTLLIPPLMDYNESNVIDKKSEIKRIYYAGNPFRNKKENIQGKDLKDRIDIIINMLVKTNENFFLDIYGITKDEYLKAFPNDVNIIKNNINFLGNIDNKIIINKIADYDFSILFRDNTKESMAGFSTKLAESITSFVPIITNNTGDIMMYIKNGLNGFIVDINNEEETIAQLKKILNLKYKELLKMKKFCQNNQIFNLNNYSEKIKLFMESFVQKDN